MEIFIFPSLLYPLVLANLMSPRIWQWREDPWFANFAKLTPYRRILRLKQFIMDHYAFNLDLETWGLTTQEKEMARFAPFMDRDTIARSNALFGYEGDRFYFDLDIRRHFGLDKYTRDVIPYWKTETVEAMDAFRFQPGHDQGAGECVSLSTLYAAALYILCGISLDDIYLVATPLHSQNFVDVHEGILTNNRRLVTKAMWFNGTELSAKARRALENEQITIVSHCTGWIHTVYPEAGIEPAAYERFRERLRGFLQTDVSPEILFNFLRQNPQRQRCFQIEHIVFGKRRWIPAEQAYAFENSCPYKVSDRTREKLLAEMDEDEFFPEPLPDRIPLNKFDDYFHHNRIDLDNEDDRQKLGREFNCYSSDACDIIRELRAFCKLEPRWPDAGGEKTVAPGPRIDLPPGLSREQIVERLEAQRATNPRRTWRSMPPAIWPAPIRAPSSRPPSSARPSASKPPAPWIRPRPRPSSATCPASPSMTPPAPPSPTKSGIRAAATAWKKPSPSPPSSMPGSRRFPLPFAPTGKPPHCRSTEPTMPSPPGKA
jgi:hypothetical protein